MRSRSDRNRDRRTIAVGEYLDRTRREILDRATPEERERYRAAERSREVYHAWNSVCQNTREGAHVTGLRYLPESNKLLVYTDDAVWTQELMMLREIIRARMERAGVALEGFVFKTSRKGYEARPYAHRATTPIVPPVPRRTPLTTEEEDKLDRDVSPIVDDKLREALKKAMKSSMEWKKGQEG